MKDKVKENWKGPEPASVSPAAVEEKPVGALSELVRPDFTKAESSIIMALIANGWRTAAIGSRDGFELLAAAEDKMNLAGAVPNSLPPAASV